MELSTSSFSNEIDKSIKEDFSVSQAAIDEIKLRKERGEKPESLSNEEIKKNDPILDTYKVLDDAIHGGMGSVWRVRHESWNTDLAMKRPQPRFFTEGSEARKEEFIRECENWINLGLHPNIVSCYYVREIGGVPTIFSEWMDNGSLKDRIKDGSLYEGTEEEVQERILDISIQTARGLQYSHENNLIHQDVKPGNILLTKDWDAKVADFGLAKAQSQLTENKKPVSTGYTIQYCPREQAEGAPAEKWMDVYAWALTVLEMYAGKRLWETGAEAKEHCEEYFRQCRIQPSLAMRELLADCLTDPPVDNFLPVGNILKDEYKDKFGHDYPRPASKAAADTAESLNNRALSFLDLNKPEEAEKMWRRALAENRGHLQSVYNYGVFRWARGQEDRLSVRQELLALRESKAREELLSHLDTTEPEAVPVRVEQLFYADGFSSTLHDPHTGDFYIVSRYLTREDDTFYLRTRHADGSMESPVPVQGCTGLSVSADGKSLCFRSDDAGSSTKIYDMRTRSFSCEDPDGKKRIYTGCAGRGSTEWYYSENGINPRLGKDRLWCRDAATGEEQLVMENFPGCYTLKLSPDGRWLVCGQESLEHCVLTVLDLTTNTPVFSRKNQRSYLADFSPDGSILYVGYRSGEIVILETSSGRVISEFYAKEKICSVCPDKSGSFLLTGHNVHDDGLVRVWDIRRTRCMMTIGTDKYPMVSFSHSPSGDLRAAAFCNKTGKYYEWKVFHEDVLPFWALNRVERTTEMLVRESRFLQTVEAGEEALKAGDLSGAIQKLEEADEIKGFLADARRLDLYRRIAAHAEKGRLKTTILLTSIPAQMYSLSPNGRFLLDKMKEKVYAVETGEAVWSLNGYYKRNQLELTEDRLLHMYVSGEKEDLMLECFSMPEGERLYQTCIRKHPGESSVVPYMYTAPDCRFILVHSTGAWISRQLIVDIKTGQVIKTPAFPSRGLSKKLLRDMRLISSDGISAPGKWLVKWQLPDDVRQYRSKTISNFMFTVDEESGLVAIRLTSITSNTLSKRAGNIAQVARELLMDRVMIFSMKTGELILDRKIPEAKGGFGNFLSRYNDEHLQLCRIRDILEKGVWCPSIDIPCPADGKIAFSTDMLVMSAAFENKINVYLLEWELST